MSKLTGQSASGATLYTHAFNKVGQVWNGTTYVNWSDGDYGDYDITTTEKGTSGEYEATNPSADIARFVMRRRASGSLALSDPKVWTGDAEDYAAQQALRATFGAPKVWVVSPTGVDTDLGISHNSAFGSFYQAFQVATAGDVVTFNGTINHSSTNPELFDEPSGGALLDHRAIAVPAGVRLVGANQTTAIITADKGGPDVTAAGDGVCFENFTINHVPRAGQTFALPIGYAAGNPTVDVVVRNVRCIADTDGAYHNSNTGDGPGRWRYYDCVFDTKYDAAVCLGTNTDQEIEYFDCQFNVVGPTVINPTANICRAITGQQGIQRIFGGSAYVTTTNEVTTTDISAVYARTGTARFARVEVHGLTVHTKVSGSYAANNYHLRCDAGAELIVGNVDHDETKVSGAIIYQAVEQSGDAFAVVSHATYGNAVIRTRLEDTFLIADTANATGVLANASATNAMNFAQSANTVVSSLVHGNAALKTLIDTVDDLLDTEVAAIKAKTDLITIDAFTAGTGDGDTAVNHNTGGADALAYKTSGGAGIDNATVRAFLTSEYDAGIVTTVRGRTVTDANGRWLAPLMLNDGIEYTIYFEKPGVYGPDTMEVTP